jgi:adenylosuccinate lyase
MAAVAAVEEGRPNPLLDLIAADGAFAAIRADLAEYTDAARFIGRAPQQVDEYLAEVEAELPAASGGAADPDEVRV